MPRPQQFLDLVPRETAAAPPHIELCSAPRKPPLWIAVCLPNLALESLSGPVADEAAVAAEPQQGQIHVVAVNARARQAGIEPGRQLSAALSLVASLKVYERSPELERRMLESLAIAAQVLTPTVSIELPASLLLEVSGSLKLFGNLETIEAKLHAELGKRRLAHELRSAPTALAALWLVRAEAPGAAALDELPGRLGALPIRVTGWPEPTQALLHDLGIRTIGDCLRLPRDGFARRVGERYLHELDLATGRRFEVRPEFTAPQRWAAALDFEETSNCDVFVAGIERLLDALVAELRARQAQVRSVRIVFKHLRRPPTLEDFALLEPTHERERLLPLLRDRLERLVLPEPAIALGLRTGPLQAMRIGAADLFAKASVESSARVLLERLRGRFGLAAVHGMGLVAEHRPECAWTKPVDALGGAARRGPPPVARNRPLWLLLEPLPLASPAARCFYAGAVEVLSGPERIESGWWDERDIGRDYYAAVSSHGQRLWIYRDRASREWHLHGLFG